MAEHKDQEEINRAEWEDPNNWSTIYFSKRDSRPSVPKRNPKQGWTINFAHPKGARWIYYLMLLFFTLGFIIGAGFGIGFNLTQ